jgi:N-acetylglutamate synthase-like GNAT family acetyltransferase
METFIIKEGVDVMDFSQVTEMLSKAYWCPGVTIDEMRKCAANSALVIGVFLENAKQVGYARVVSDKTRFAYVLDVIVDEQCRKQGIGQKMMHYLLSHEQMKEVYQWLLMTKDAHGVYAKVGFKPLTYPSAWMEIRKARTQR